MLRHQSNPREKGKAGVSPVLAAGPHLESTPGLGGERGLGGLCGRRRQSWGGEATVVARAPRAEHWGEKAAQRLVCGGLSRALGVRAPIPLTRAGYPSGRISSWEPLDKPLLAHQGRLPCSAPSGLPLCCACLDEIVCIKCQAQSWRRVKLNVMFDKRENTWEGKLRRICM